MLNCILIAPVGAYGNHLRWLILCNSQLKINFYESLSKSWNQFKDSYANIKGEDWPKLEDLYEEFSNLDIDISFDIKNWCKNLNFKIEDVFSKYRNYNFLLDEVYTPSRTWHNWLIVEWQYREYLDDLILLMHNYEHDSLKNKKVLKKIICKIEPNVAYLSYLKFNSNLNNTSKENFISNIASWNQYVDSLSEDNSYLIIDSTLLFDKNLDKKVYNTIVDFLSLSNDYKIANKVHNTWFNLHIKAQKEIVYDLQKIYIN